MIQQDKINLAATNYATSMKSDLKSTKMCKNDFKKGVLFAEEELKNLAIEFAEWLNNHIYFEDWCNFKKDTKDLFELFKQEKYDN
jgi:hypothetical protein